MLFSVSEKMRIYSSFEIRKKGKTEKIVEI